MKELEIKFIGKDSHGRPVYETEDGLLLKNIELNGVPTQGNLTTVLYNNFDGEPDFPLKYKTKRYVFTVVKEFLRRQQLIKQV